MVVVVVLGTSWGTHWELENMLWGTQWEHVPKFPACSPRCSQYHHNHYHTLSQKLCQKLNSPLPIKIGQWGRTFLKFYFGSVNFFWFWGYWMFGKMYFCDGSIKVADCNPPPKKKDKKKRKRRRRRRSNFGKWMHSITIINRTKQIGWLYY